MGKVAKIALVAFAVGINVIPGAGQLISGALSGAIIGALGGTFAAAAIASIAVPVLLAAATASSLPAGTGPLRRRRPTPGDDG